MRKMSVVLLVVLSFFLPVSAMSADFPSKPIQLVVPYKPGGGSDVSARIFAQCLERTSLPEKVIVKNINGARGKTGEMEVKRSRPDGYTLLWQHQGLHIAHVTGRSEYTYKDFTPVAMTAVNNAGIFVPKSLGVSNLKELIAKLKAEPSSVPIGAAVNGLSHFGLLSWLDKTELDANKLKIVGMSGDKKRIIAMMQGNLKMSCVAVNAAKPYVESGDLVGIGVLAPERDPGLPNLPTMKEQGYDSVLRTEYGTWAPKGIPSDVEAVIVKAWMEAAADPECAKKMAVNSVNLVSYEGDEFDKYENEAFNMYKHLAEKYGMKK